ncbi:NAD(P)-dependent oxidoreductase [Chimaeribacter californicus]|uniref:NAD(P)-dependent oxidoreductase n=1 Tax=Chimaeribacter californicus TaxID=2060067 RepID=A0A2N5DYE5_9GAMM|nr:SDR family oxidoreductase [Chimaeribacter californicus]PLR32582.1 NAD(P)-dependent oxidoreductase [Chimaeribacter californicus]
MIAVTGATGQLGRLVIEALLKKVSASEIVAAVRNPAKAQDLKELGITVREADYSKPETLKTAFSGVDKLLLISSSEVGQRSAQHQAVIDAAKEAGVKLVAYTSLLNLENSPLLLAREHRDTEAALRSSGLPYVLLRNGWYTENYAASIAPALAHNAFIGSAGEGRISSAPRIDYAFAAAAVLLMDNQEGKVYELAGDDSYTLNEFAAEIARQSGKEVNYVNLPQADFATALKKAGLPDGLADVLADSDMGASKGALYDENHALSQLLGRPTVSYKEVIAESLKAL